MFTIKNISATGVGDPQNVVLLTKPGANYEAPRRTPFIYVGQCVHTDRFSTMMFAYPASSSTEKSRRCHETPKIRRAEFDTRGHGVILTLISHPRAWKHPTKLHRVPWCVGATPFLWFSPMKKVTFLPRCTRLALTLRTLADCRFRV